MAGILGMCQERWGRLGAQQGWGGRSIGLQQGAMEPDEGLTKRPGMLGADLGKRPGDELLSKKNGVVEKCMGGWLLHKFLQSWLC